jgi:hypothetical protein
MLYIHDKIPKIKPPQVSMSDKDFFLRGMSDKDFNLANKPKHRCILQTTITLFMIILQNNKKK